MDYFWNAIKARAAGLDGLSGVARFGLVTSFDPVSYAARVLIQPENILSGWLPVVSNWVGAGWGVCAPLSPGSQVLVISQEGDSEQGVIIGSVWSTVELPPGAPVGELWLVHQSGSYIKMHNDGSLALQAATVNIYGNLVVSGDVSDRGGTHGTLNGLRSVYDMHTHSDPQGGVTSQPLEVL